MGLGLAAIRDVGSFLRHQSADDHGTGNPLAGQIEWSLLNGISQSGACCGPFCSLASIGTSGSARSSTAAAAYRFGARLHQCPVRAAGPAGRNPAHREAVSGSGRAAHVRQILRPFYA